MFQANYTVGTAHTRLIPPLTSSKSFKGGFSKAYPLTHNIIARGNRWIVQTLKGLLVTDDWQRHEKMKANPRRDFDSSLCLGCAWDLADRQAHEITDDYGLCDVVANLKRLRTFSHNLQLYKKTLPIISKSISMYWEARTYAWHQCDYMCVFAVNLGA